MLAIRRRGHLSAAAIICLVALLSPPSAGAAPRAEDVEVRSGTVARLTGTGCTSRTLAHALPGTGDVVAFRPAVGAAVGDLDSVTVTDARVQDGQAIWTVEPAADECAFYAEDPSWSWETEARAWSAIQASRAFVIRAARYGGVRSIAGFRVKGYTRRTAPTISRARRFFGRPSSLRRRYDVACRAHWKRIGLTIDLLHLGGRDPCRHGFVQTGLVSSRGTATWTAVVGRRPGVADGTRARFFDHAGIGERGRPRRWTLAEVWLPYGEAGYQPALSARLSRGATRGFEFYVGAGGD